MAELSGVWTTGTSGDGTSTYTQAQASTFFTVLAACHDLEGVAPGYLNELAVTGTSSPVAVATGGALVDGKVYNNSASVNVTVATPVTSTRIDRIVLRASWADYTVRITRIAGAEGGAAPAMVKTSGTTYDISLATVSITTGGVITVTDARDYACINTTWAFGSQVVPGTAIVNDAITGAKIADDSIDSEHYVDGSIDMAHLAAPEAWINATLINSWANSGGGAAPARYYKDLLGIVHLEGMIESGANASVAFALPSGYRPAYSAFFLVLAAGNPTATPNEVLILANGNVTIYLGGALTGTGLDGITFRAA